MSEESRSDFADWAIDPARTREERFGCELLIEDRIGHWRHQHNVTVPVNYEADRLRKKERQLNPAYEPGYSEEDARRVSEILPTTDTLSFSQWSDRPLRDLSFLRFCPALTGLTLYSTELADLSPLAHLPALRELRLSDRVLEDLRPVASLRQLELLHVTLDCPWPDLTGWESLDQLRDLDFMGNILALREVPRLLGVRAAKIHKKSDVIPLRTVADLPEMPELRTLFLENTWRLDGIGRFPHLLNLTTYGHYRDLTPLTALQELTHLFVSGSAFETIEPLSHLANLRRVTIRRELPQDYTPLAVLPHLHEVVVELCPSSRLEIMTLHAALSPWADEFIGHPPRTLQTLRLRVEKIGTEWQRVESATTPRAWGEDKEMGESETRWFSREVNRRLNTVLGKGWGKLSTRYGMRPGNVHVPITRPEDLDRLPEAVDCLRQIIATARHPWTVLLCIDSMRRYERDMAEIEEDDDLVREDKEEFDAEQERVEWEDTQRRQRERQEYLERVHRYRLRQEQGLPFDPEEFAPPSEEPEPEEKSAAGEIPGPAHEFDLGTEISLYVFLTESSLFISAEQRGLAEMLLETKAEEPADAAEESERPKA